MSYGTVEKYPSFPHSDPKYQCNCGIHVMKGAKYIGTVHATLLVVSLIVASAKNSYMPSAGASAIVFHTICLTLLFVGLNNENPKYLSPYIANIILWLIGSAITVIVWIYMKINQPQDDQIPLLLKLLILGVLALSFVLHMWWLNVIRCCKAYLSDLEQYKLHHSTSVETAVV